MKTLTLFLTLFVFPALALAQASQPATQPASAVVCNSKQIFTNANCAGDGLDPNEQKLVDLIDEYRMRNNLPPIKASKALTKVANRHVHDLAMNIRDLTHAWSNCPYDADNQGTHPCMWNAPQRFGTTYPGNGYENAYGGGGDPEGILAAWKSSARHNAVILELDTWQGYNWQALGVSIGGGYAVMWVGKETDPNQPEVDTPVSLGAGCNSCGRAGFFRGSGATGNRTVPNLGIQEDLTYWPVALGIIYMPLPTGDDSVTLPSLSFGWMHVDRSFMHAFEGKAGLGSVSQVADFSYTFGFGQRKGMWHVGLQTRLGYAHLYDQTQKHLHALNYAFGPCLNFTLPWLLKPEKWRFYIAGGVGGIVASNADYTGYRQFKAWFLDFGGAFGIN